jgi:hypothetical protein
MTDPEPAADRRATIAKAIAAHRREGHDSPVRLVALTDGGDDTDPENAPAVAYHDREITVEVSDRERERLDALLAEFPVFKIAQPETRKAASGTVVVSAIADPKHAADFLDRLFLSVYETSEGFEIETR